MEIRFFCFFCFCFWRPPSSSPSLDGLGPFGRPSAVDAVCVCVFVCPSLKVFFCLVVRVVVVGWIPKLTMRKTFSSLPVEWSGWWMRNVCEQALDTHTRLDPSFFFFSSSSSFWIWICGRKTTDIKKSHGTVYPRGLLVLLLCQKKKRRPVRFSFISLPMAFNVIRKEKGQKDSFICCRVCTFDFCWYWRL